MDEAALATILAMAVVTYATRAGGLWLGNRISVGPRVDALLAGLPGAILVSLVAPAIVSAGAVGLVAAASTVLMASRFRGKILLPMVVGVAVVWTLRLL
jgi:uncharacterized membrane protein